MPKIGRIRIMILTCILSLSAVGSFLTCWALPVRNAWLILIFVGFFAAYAVGLLFLYALFLLISSLLLPNKEYPPKKSRFAFWVVKHSCVLIRQISGARMAVTGLESVPDEPYLLVANHRSNMDPILAISILKKRPIGFLTKAGNMKIPIVGPYVRRADFLTIDRENPLRAVRTIRDAAELVKRDSISYGVYPEGTRNFTEETLLPFHDGVLMIAQKANLPVVVAVMQNSQQIAKRFPFRSTKIPFDILHVYSAEEVRNRRTTELSEEIRAMMLAHLEKAKA